MFSFTTKTYNFFRLKILLFFFSVALYSPVIASVTDFSNDNCHPRLEAKAGVCIYLINTEIKEEIKRNLWFISENVDYHHGSLKNVEIINSLQAKKQLPYCNVFQYLWQDMIIKYLIVFILTIAGIWLTLKVMSYGKQKHALEQVIASHNSQLEKSYMELQQRQDEIINQNKEISIQRDEIQKKNEELELSYQKLKILNQFGQQLTSTLNLESINNMIYDYVSSLLDTELFGIGVYDVLSNCLVFSRFMDKKIAKAQFSESLDDGNSCSVWCFTHQKPIISNDFEVEYKNYIGDIRNIGTKIPGSAIYLPLTVMHRKIGVLTVQSYRKKAYNDNDLQSLQSLASYVSIALYNAIVYDIMRSQRSKLEKHQYELERLVQERTSDLMQAKIKAEESDRLKSAFLANMSHEIRTPLNAIVGFINLLNEDMIDEEEKKRFYQIIQSNGFSLLNLINDIIDFSKIEAGQLDITVSEVHLDKLFNELLLIHQEEIKNHKIDHGKNVELLLKIPLIESFPVLQTDFSRLKQIFSNLLGNAIKFTNEGTIEFGIKKITNTDEILFFVKDTGIGIEKKNFKVIFERFRKIEDDNITVFRGAGLGLSITKYLVERLNGEIWLDSVKGEGTEFIFSLPLMPTTDNRGESKFRADQKNIDVPDWSDKGVLIAEDESSNFMVISSMLKKTNIKTLWAKDGQEAIELFDKNKEWINLVLLDIKLPKKNGFEVFRAIKQASPNTPVIAQTAYALPEEENQIRDENFDDYLAKPILRDKLLKILYRFLN